MSSTKTALLIFTLTSLIFLGIFSYGMYTIRAKGQMTSTLVNEVDTANEEEERAISIQALKNNSKETLVAFDKFALSEEKIVPLIEMVEERAKALGLDVNTASVSVDKQDPKSPTTYEKVRVVIETDGGWGPSLKFLKSLENLPVSAVIESSDLGVQEKTSLFKSASSTTDSTRSGSGKVWRTSTVLILFTFK